LADEHQGRNGRFAFPYLFVPGDEVRVTGGPFKGAEGYIKRIRGNRRLVVALEGIIAVATTYIPGRFLEKMPEN
jgi:transcription antitermination factor NusG